jgi:hypothetical protein
MPITSNSRTFDQSSSFKNTYMTPFDEGLSGQANNRKHDMWRDMFAFQDIVKQDKYMNGRDKETARQFTWLLCAMSIGSVAILTFASAVVVTAGVTMTYASGLEADSFAVSFCYILSYNLLRRKTRATSEPKRQKIMRCI